MAEMEYATLGHSGILVLGYGCGTPDMTRRSQFMEEACRLGASL